MDKSEIILALDDADGIGIQSVKKIVEEFVGVADLSLGQVKKLIKNDMKLAMDSNLEEVLSEDYIEEKKYKLHKKGIGFLSYLDEDYPGPLKEIYDPPPVLYYRGDVGLLNGFCIGIVGSRKPTAYGNSVAKNFARELSSCGITIVSGMAIGIDSCSHKASLDQKGKTIAVLGSSVDRPYPKRNERLMNEIIENGGCVVSEHSMEIDALPVFFPMRNRIISGMSRGIVVVEAAKRSGTLITCDFALEQGRDVFSVPGNINSKMSMGTNELIRKGAMLVSCARDIIEEYPQFSYVESSELNVVKNISQTEKNILELLQRQGPTHVDEISIRLAMNVKDVIGVLNILEIKGIVMELKGKTYDINL